MRLISVFGVMLAAGVAGAVPLELDYIYPAGCRRGDSCTVTVAHSRTKDLPAVCRQADILVAAVGRPEMIRGDWVKPGATVIDVGINRVPAPEKGEGRTRLVGDCHFESCAEVAGAITPGPGGVGPMTIACLLANTVTACCRATGLPEPEGLTV